MEGIEGVDEAAGTVFFPANKDDPRQRHIFSVQLDGSGFKALTPEEGIHAANFSDDGKHYAHMFGAERSPSISLCAVGGACSPVWQARDEIAEYGLREPKYLEFKADDGTTLYGRLLLPPDASASGKIPLIVNIYGGPAGQMVRKRHARSRSTKFWRARDLRFSRWTIAARRDAIANSRRRSGMSLARLN